MTSTNASSDSKRHADSTSLDCSARDRPELSTSSRAYPGYSFEWPSPSLPKEYFENVDLDTPSLKIAMHRKTTFLTSLQQPLRTLCTLVKWWQFWTTSNSTDCSAFCPYFFSVWQYMKWAVGITCVWVDGTLTVAHSCATSSFTWVFSCLATYRKLQVRHPLTDVQLDRLWNSPFFLWYFLRGSMRKARNCRRSIIQFICLPLRVAIYLLWNVTHVINPVRNCHYIFGDRTYFQW